MWTIALWWAVGFLVVGEMIHLWLAARRKYWGSAMPIKRLNLGTYWITGVVRQGAIGARSIVLVLGDGHRRTKLIELDHCCALRTKTGDDGQIIGELVVESSDAYSLLVYDEAPQPQREAPVVVGDIDSLDREAKILKAAGLSRALPPEDLVESTVKHLRKIDELIASLRRGNVVEIKIDGSKETTLAKVVDFECGWWHSPIVKTKPTDGTSGRAIRRFHCEILRKIESTP